MNISFIKQKMSEAFGRFGKKNPDLEKMAEKAPSLEKATVIDDGELRTDPVPAKSEKLESQYLDEGVIVLGKQKYAVHLNWRPVDSESTIKAQAEQAKSSINAFLNYEFFADLRKSDQIGFAASEIGHAVGMPVMAASIPEHLTGPRWIGAFRIGESGEHWWVVSIRDGAVYEDVVINGTIDAMSRLSDEMEAPDWTRIFAPPGWDIPGSTEALIGDVVDPSKILRLRPVAPLRTYALRIVIAGALIGLTVIGYFLYEEIQRKAQEEMDRLARQQNREVIVYIADFPWQNSTRVRDYADICRDEIEKSVFLVPGWQAQPVSCQINRGEGTVVAGWNRANDGRISWLRAAMPEGYPDPVLSPEGQSASLTRSFEAPYIEELREVDHWEPSRITSVLRERFQTLGLELSLSQRARATGPRVRQEEPIFNYHEFSVSTDFVVREHARLFSDVPALVVDAMIFNVSTGTWTLSGKAFHEPILPLNTELR